MMPFLLFMACLLGSFFFSGFETGFYALNPLPVLIRVSQGNARARRIMHSYLADRERLLGTFLIGNNLCHYFAVVLFTGWLVSAFSYLGEFSIVVITTALMTPLMLVFCEMLPKILFQARANTWVEFFEGVVCVVWYLFWPLAVMLRLFAVSMRNLLLRRRTVVATGEFLTRRTLIEVFSQGDTDEAIGTAQGRLAQEIMLLSQVKLSDVLTPWQRAIGIGMTATHDEIMRCIRSTNVSRLLVFEDAQKKQVKGYVSAFDILMSADTRSLASWIKPVVELGEEMALDDALIHLLEQRAALAVVRAGDGALVGLVTVKDLLARMLAVVK